MNASWTQPLQVGACGSGSRRPLKRAGLLGAGRGAGRAPGAGPDVAGQEARGPAREHAASQLLAERAWPGAGAVSEVGLGPRAGCHSCVGAPAGHRTRQQKGTSLRTRAGQPPAHPPRLEGHQGLCRAGGQRSEHCTRPAQGRRCRHQGALPSRAWGLWAGAPGEQASVSSADGVGALLPCARLSRRDPGRAGASGCMLSVDAPAGDRTHFPL